MSLGVLPLTEGQGVGQALVETFLADMRRVGVAEVFLTTDAKENKRVNNFYVRLGFQRRRQIRTPEERVLNEYFIRLRDLSKDP